MLVRMRKTNKKQVILSEAKDPSSVFLIMRPSRTTDWREQNCMHSRHGLRTPLTISPECIFSKDSRQSASGEMRLRIRSS